jgi:hypothetical protein
MKTGVAGSRLGVGRAKDQFQVASCELQARKTKKTRLGVGGRRSEEKENWFSVERFSAGEEKGVAC